VADISIENNRHITGIDLFVFDKDGTIIDLYNYWYHMIELRARRLCGIYNLPAPEHMDNLMSEMGIDIQNKRLKPEGPVGLLPREVVQKAAEGYLGKQGCGNTAESCFRVFKEVDMASEGILDKLIKPIDGAIDLLRCIKHKKAKVAIATTDKTHRAELAVKFLGIEGLVDIVVGADKVKNSKPAPDMLALIGAGLNIGPSRSVMIGDAGTDIRMGINAKFKASIAVCSGLTARDELAELTPYIADDISKIRIE